jgi:hypothetical protein
LAERGAIAALSKPVCLGKYLNPSQGKFKRNE